MQIISASNVSMDISTILLLKNVIVRLVIVINVIKMMEQFVIRAIIIISCKIIQIKNVSHK